MRLSLSRRLQVLGCKKQTEEEKVFSAFGNSIKITNEEVWRSQHFNPKALDAGYVHPVQQYFAYPLIGLVIGFFILALRSVKESKIATVGLSLVTFWVAIAISAPILPLQDPLEKSTAFSQNLAKNNMSILMNDVYLIYQIVGEMFRRHVRLDRLYFYI